MFVTSDIYDLKAIGRWRGFDWRENLIGGVDVHGAEWLGYEAGAAFLLEAARHCGLLREMRWAGYNRPGDKRTRPLKPTSFERLAQGRLFGAKTARSVLLRGEVAAPGSRLGDVLVGGEASALQVHPHDPSDGAAGGDRWFSADFIFPIGAQPAAKAAELLRLAVDVLDAEYGYYFVRDDLCGPWLYASGMVVPLDYSQLNKDDEKEVWEWRQYVRTGAMWSGEWPLLRDLFEVNLISERHTSVRVEGIGYLTDWIGAQPGRGRLEDLGRGRCLWILTDAEMFVVRPILNAAGMLKSCRDRIYRDLHPGTGLKPTAARWCYTSPPIG